MPEELRYLIIFGVLVLIGIIDGFARLVWPRAKSNDKAGRERNLAIGNFEVGLFGALLAAVVTDYFRPNPAAELAESIREAGSTTSNEIRSAAVASSDATRADIETAIERAIVTRTGPALWSDPACLERWGIQGRMWHYSLTRANGEPAWQLANPEFAFTSPSRVTGVGTWVNAVTGASEEYVLEAGCRGTRGVLIFTHASQHDVIPTIEVYPALPDNIQAQMIGYAVDQTWDEHEVLAPVILSREPIGGVVAPGPVLDTALGETLNEIWRTRYEAHTGKAHRLTVCDVAYAPGQ